MCNVDHIVPALRSCDLCSTRLIPHPQPACPSVARVARARSNISGHRVRCVGAMLTAQEDLAAGPGLRAINQAFRRNATEEERNKLDALVGNTAKSTYRIAWHKKRLSNMSGVQTLKENEKKTDCSDGWYMNELQLIQDLGGLIDMANATQKAQLIMNKRLEKGWPWVVWDADLEEVCYYNARKGHRSSSSTETSREIAGDFEITEEAAAEAERKGLGKLPDGVIEAALKKMQEIVDHTEELQQQPQQQHS